MFAFAYYMKQSVILNDEICLLNPPIACKAEHIVYRSDNLNINSKKETSFINLFTICDPYTHQGLSSHTTFSQI
jgi:hypothetical protein